MPSNKRMLDRISKSMGELAKWGENSMFVSQYKENDRDKATVVVCLAKEDGSSSYLACRRLLQAFKYRLEKETNLKLDFNITRKRGGE